MDLANLWEACRSTVTKCGAQTALLRKQEQAFSESPRAAEPSKPLCDYQSLQGGDLPGVWSRQREGISLCQLPQLSLLPLPTARGDVTSTVLGLLLRCGYDNKECRCRGLNMGFNSCVGGRLQESNPSVVFGDEASGGQLGLKKRFGYFSIALMKCHNQDS